MFVTSGQLYYFLGSIAYGSVIGFCLSTTFFLKRRNFNKVLSTIFDVLIYVIASILFILYTYKLNYPNVRLYMIFGVFLGILIYLKSLNIVLAKILKKLYNILKKKKVKFKWTNLRKKD